MSRRILTVDDSRTMRDMLGQTLRSYGYDVVEAEDGEEALRVLGTAPVCLVITDLNMPVMDGLTLVKTLRGRSQTRYTPILMLTTEADSAAKERGRAAGATGWLVKPFNPEKLIAVVEKVCA